MRLRLRVHPGADRDAVGGRYGDEEPPVLVVRVRARAVDGRANDAVLAVLAEAFGVGRRDVRLLTGASARTKLVEIEHADEATLALLLDRNPRTVSAETDS